MIFPIGDTPNPRHFTPWVNWALIALNVLIFLGISLPLSLTPADPADPLLAAYLHDLAARLPPQALQGLQVSAYDLFVYAHGYKPGAPSLADLLSAMFLHAGAAHLLGNMLFLWIYGDNVEHRLGRALYLAVYLLAGAVATLSFGLLAGTSMTPLVGASGAISGVLGLYFLFFPRNRVKLFVFLFPFLVDVFLVPARLVLGMYVLLDNLLPILTRGASGGGVAYGAHLGGFFAGLLLALGVEYLLPRRASRRLAGPHGRPPPPQEVLQDALSAGIPAEILAALQGLPPERLAALSPPELQQIAAVLAETGHTDEGVWLARQALRSHPQNAGLHVFLGQVWLYQGQHAAAYQALRRAEELDPHGEAGAAARAALSHIALHRRQR